MLTELIENDLYRYSVYQPLCEKMSECIINFSFNKGLPTKLDSLQKGVNMTWLFSMTIWMMWLEKQKCKSNLPKVCIT